MWSGPRNISTALMRSFENRPDCFVSDEPFYSFFLCKTGLNHPMRDEIIQSEETNYNKIIRYITGPIPHLNKIWYQKHMAHHILVDSNIDWIKKMKNCILIRHPKDVILSYTKKNEIEDIYQLGYPQQVNIYKILSKETKYTPIIIDARDLLLNPEVALIRICEKLEIDFDLKMLSWPSGTRKTDGVWGKHWYKQVEASTAFKPFKENKQNVPAKYIPIYNQCMEHYNHLYKKRLILE